MGVCTQGAVSATNAPQVYHSYKIVFGFVDLKCDDFFQFCASETRGHPSFSHTNTRRPMSFCSQRIVSIWNSLPNTVDFHSLSSFKRTTSSVTFVA